MREGSMCLPHKNRKMLCGKPLYAWTVEQAISIKEIDIIYITTDDHDIIEGCLKYEEQDIRVKVIVRPAYLATSETEPWAVIEHACQGHRDDAVVIWLQVTTPLRTREDILNCILGFELYGKSLGLIATSYKHPEHEFKLRGALFMHYLGTIRTTKSFIHQIILNYVMPPERSIDIDYEEDFIKCEIEMQKRLDKK